jgi:thiamine pyrophosphokinase
MNSPIVQTTSGITLAGGGPFGRRDLRLCLARAPVPVAADGGADRLLAFGVSPVAVIGDFDSLSAAALRSIPPDRQHPMAEQATTDFDKALRSVRAPFVLALGFAGARQDHGLAALNTLVRRPEQRCIVLGPRDLIFAAPDRLALDLVPGDVLSLFPMRGVRGRSRGLAWPIDGLDLAPDGMIGTSNRVEARRVALEFDRPGMLVILPRARLDAAIRALLAAAWPAPRSARGE